MRFMHIADVHLGYCPDAGQEWSSMRGREVWDTFRGIIEDAKRESVDLLLIAGDLFDSSPTVQELREVDYLFSGLTGTRIVLIAGNHDHLQPGSPYLSHQWSQNVVCLFSTECECVRFPEIRTEVYGFSYDRQEMTDPLPDTLHPVDNGYCHILLVHGGDAKHLPFTKTTLEKSGFDYIALGHIHQPQTLIRNKAIYPGCPEALSIADLGERGYILGEQNGKHISVRFVPKTKRQYHLLEVEASVDDTTYSLADMITDTIRKIDPGDIYRIILTGKRCAGTQYDQEKLREAGRITEVDDRTIVDFDPEQLRNEYAGTLIGRYIDSFAGEEDDPVAKKALCYGIEALLGSRKK